MIHLHATVGGDLVGYAQLDVGTQTSTKAELVVDPAHRRAGVGRALLTRALAETAVVPGRTLRVWAHGDLPAARAVRRGRRTWPSCASCCRCAST